MAQMGDDQGVCGRWGFVSYYAQIVQSVKAGRKKNVKYRL